MYVTACPVDVDACNSMSSGCVNACNSMSSGCVDACLS